MRDNNKQIQEQFSASAAMYRTSRVHAQGADLQKLAEFAATHGEGNLILDVGCGAGHTTMAVAPHAEKVIAFDLTEGMLLQVQSLAEERNIHNVETKQGTVEALPFEDNTFDIIVTRYSAHHWTNPEQALAECYRVLKPDGEFFFVDVLGHDAPQTDTVLQAIELLRDNSHVRDHRASEWQQMMQSVGFSSSVDSIWHIDLVFKDWLKRMNVPSHKEDMIRIIFSEVSDEIRETFKMDDDFNFSLLVGLIKCVKS